MVLSRRLLKFFQVFFELWPSSKYGCNCCCLPRDFSTTLLACKELEFFLFNFHEKVENGGEIRAARSFVRLKPSEWKNLKEFNVEE